MMTSKTRSLTLAACVLAVLGFAIAPIALVRAQTLSGSQNWAFIHTARVTADFTDGNGVTTLQNITGLTLSFPAAPAAVVYQIDCDVYYSQATVVADNFGVQFVGNSPTSAILGGIAATNATAYASGTPPTITSTTATNVISMTPGVTTVLYAHIGGTAEIASSGLDTQMNVQVAQSTAADVIVIKRGSICRWSAMP